MELTSGAITRVAHGLLWTIAFAAPASAIAATKVDEGFATRYVSVNGEFVRPANKVRRARAGEDVYYWIEWKDHPVGHSRHRCVIKSATETIYDDTQDVNDGEAEGFTSCGLETDSGDGGTYSFTQYLDGEMVGQSSILLEESSFWGRISGYRKIKYVFGAIAGLILAGYWLRKKMQGDHKGAAAVFGSGGAASSPPGAVVIGSRVNESSLQAAPAPKPPDEGDALQDFKKRVAADPAFRLARAEDVLPIAKAARAAGEPQLAVAALRGFDKTFPGHTLIPEVFVFTAKLMAEDLKNPEMAKKILAHVVQKYPGHYLAQDAKRYLQTLG